MVSGDGITLELFNSVVVSSMDLRIRNLLFHTAAVL